MTILQAVLLGIILSLVYIIFVYLYNQRKTKTIKLKNADYSNESIVNLTDQQLLLRQMQTIHINIVASNEQDDFDIEEYADNTYFLSELKKKIYENSIDKDKVNQQENQKEPPAEEPTDFIDVASLDQTQDE